MQEQGSASGQLEAKRLLARELLVLNAKEEVRKGVIVSMITELGIPKRVDRIAARQQVGLGCRLPVLVAEDQAHASDLQHRPRLVFAVRTPHGQLLRPIDRRLCCDQLDEATWPVGADPLTELLVLHRGDSRIQARVGGLPSREGET